MLRFRWLRLFKLGLAWAALATTTVAAADPIVHLEIVQAPGGAIDGPHRWSQHLQRLQLTSVRIRRPRPGDRPQVEQRGSADQPTFHITAVLTSRNELQFPGATFRPGDEAKLSRWLADLGSEGPSDRATVAFGLTDVELVKLRRDLATPVRDSTVERTGDVIVRDIQQRLSVPVGIDPAARTAFTQAPVIADELKGLAEGTVLAAVLRPAGLALLPERGPSGTVGLKIVSAESANEVWPIGWPSRQDDRKTIPKLFEFLPVEIVATPLSDALEAIQPRLGVPLLIDRNGLAARQIDLDTVKVRYPAGRTFYKKLLDRLLFQARLEAVIRVDEGNRPFLWIQPLGR